MLNRFRLTGLETADPGHVYITSRQEAAINIAVNRLFTARKFIRVTNNNVVDGLTISDQGANELVQTKKFFF
jgi:hypothetical protein